MWAGAAGSTALGPCTRLPTGKLSKPFVQGLWRLYGGPTCSVIDLVTGHSCLILPPDPLPSLGVRGGTEGSNPLITPWSSWGPS